MTEQSQQMKTRIEVLRGSIVTLRRRVAKCQEANVPLLSTLERIRYLDDLDEIYRLAEGAITTAQKHAVQKRPKCERCWLPPLSLPFKPSGRLVVESPEEWDRHD
jgi:hypothetical protein